LTKPIKLVIYKKNKENTKMNIAEKIIKRFGGQTQLAKLIGKNQSTVQYWAKAGTVPTKWHKQLLKIASEKSIHLSPSDFVYGESTNNTNISVEPVGPKATHWGELEIGDTILPCYVLENGERVFSLKGVVVGLIGTEGGQLAEYIKVKPLKPFLSKELAPAENGSIPALIKFDTGGKAFTRYAWGLPVEKFIDLCEAYSKAAEAAEGGKLKLTDRQRKTAVNANRFLRASAKVGIIALVDEVTGYQYERAVDALQFKLKLFLEEDMRKWEKTFPDELWEEFGRLTNWHGALHQRPKYWGKLVMELVYDYLDPDVAQWLKENAPKPQGGQNYHQWLSNHYGLKKLVEHIWMLIGMARSCSTMRELKERMGVQYGRQNVQLNLFLPPPKKTIKG
jgi:P63C domain-containing protein